MPPKKLKYVRENVTYRYLNATAEGSLTYATIEALTKAASSGNHKPSTRVYGSSFYKCARMQVYDILKVAPGEKKYVYEWALSADVGNALHEIVQKQLFLTKQVAYIAYFSGSERKIIAMRQRNQKQPAIEVPYNKWTLHPEPLAEITKLNLGIRADVFIYRGKGIAPGEIKSVGDNYFSNYDKLVKYKLPGYDAQWQLQCHFMRVPSGSSFSTTQGVTTAVTKYDRPKSGMLYLINSNWWQQRKEIVLDYDADFVSDAVKRIDIINSHIKAGTLPKPEKHTGDCNFCLFAYRCPAQTGVEDTNASGKPLVLKNVPTFDPNLPPELQAAIPDTFAATTPNR